jgi:ATP-binding cassette subfamily C protein CydC
LISFWKQLWQWRRRFGLGLLLGLVTLLSGLVLLALSGWFISAAALAGLTVATAAQFDIFRPGALIRLSAVLRTAGRYGERLASHDAVLHLLSSLRSQVYRRLLPRLPTPRLGSGELLERVVADVNTLDELPLRLLAPVVWAAVILLAVLALLYWQSVELMLRVLPWLLLGAVVLPLLLALVAGHLGRRQRQLAGQRREALIEALQGMISLHLHGAWERQQRALEAIDRRVLATQFRQSLVAALGQAVLVALLGFAVGSILKGGISLVQAGPYLAMAALAVLGLQEALSALPAAFQAAAQGRAALNRLSELGAITPATAFPASGPELSAMPGLVVEEVTFRYPGRTQGLEAVSLELPFGQWLTLQGESGAGKTTLARLLVRLQQPDSGRILLAGQPLEDYDEPTLRRAVHYVEQQPYLFNASVADNLRLARPDADEEALWQALAVVQLEAVVRGLPHGLNTLIGEYGTGLSGGQARRLALARAVLAAAPITILDEPFEGLDRPTAEAVMAGLAQVLAGRSLILISHRPVGLEYMDRVLRLRA